MTMKDVGEKKKTTYDKLGDMGAFFAKRPTPTTLIFIGIFRFWEFGSFGGIYRRWTGGYRRFSKRAGRGECRGMMQVMALPDTEHI